MRLIKPSYNILTNFDLYKNKTKQELIDIAYKEIEIAGRTCYKSEENMTPDSAKSFVDRMIKSEHCYTGEVEVLTIYGWIKFKDYNGEKVATINKNRSLKGFEVPINVIKKEYEGNFYNYPSLGLEVTEGHKMFGMFANNSEDRTKPFIGELFECNSNYKDSNNREKTLGERWFKTSSSCLYNPNILPNFQLVGFWLGDGCRDSGKNNLKFHLKKERKVEYLKEICSKLNLKWEYKNYNFYVFEDGIGDFFRNTYVKDKIKYIFPDLENQDEIYSIIDGLINSDGSIQKTGITFSNKSNYLIDFILSRGCLVGYNVVEGNISKNDTRKLFLLNRKENINNDSRIPNSKVKLINKKEEVYCVTVSTGLILVRGTNGKTTICGNCAMLEHGTIYLKLLHGSYDNKTLFKYKTNKYSKYKSDTKGNLYITTNFRVIVENNWLEDLMYICAPTKYHEKRVSVRFIMDRIGSQSFVRHRVFSFAQESTRFCNYSKDKFGNEITFIIPNWSRLNESSHNIEWNGLYGVNEIDFSDNETSIWFWALSVAERDYFKLIKKGWSPQQARSVLPNSLKTELIMTGLISDWEHFFTLRCPSSAHPQARELAIPLSEDMKKLIK